MYLQPSQSALVYILAGNVKAYLGGKRQSDLVHVLAGKLIGGSQSLWAQREGLVRLLQLLLVAYDGHAVLGRNNTRVRNDNEQKWLETKE